MRGPGATFTPKHDGRPLSSVPNLSSVFSVTRFFLCATIVPFGCPQGSPTRILITTGADVCFAGPIETCQAVQDVPRVQRMAYHGQTLCSRALLIHGGHSHGVRLWLPAVQTNHISRIIRL